MLRYLCLSIFFGSFAFLTVSYSFLVAFAVMYCGSMLVVIGTALAIAFSKKKRSRASVVADQPVYSAGKELMESKTLHAVRASG